MYRLFQLFVDGMQKEFWRWQLFSIVYLHYVKMKEICSLIDFIDSVKSFVSVQFLLKWRKAVVLLPFLESAHSSVSYQYTGCNNTIKLIELKTASKFSGYKWKVVLQFNLTKFFKISTFGLLLIMSKCSICIIPSWYSS